MSSKFFTNQGTNTLENRLHDILKNYNIKSYNVPRKNNQFIKSSRVNLKYITALLNSKLMYFYMQERLKHTGDLLQIDKNQFMKIPLFVPENIKTFEIAVDYILFAKKQDMNNETSLFESIIDGMVYDIYFEEEMKKADCFISDEVSQVIQEFDGSSDMIQDMYKVFKENKIIQRGLMFRKTISVVAIIEEKNKNGLI